MIRRARSTSAATAAGPTAAGSATTSTTAAISSAATSGAATSGATTSGATTSGAAASGTTATGTRTTYCCAHCRSRPFARRGTGRHIRYRHIALARALHHLLAVLRAQLLALLFRRSVAHPRLILLTLLFGHELVGEYAFTLLGLQTRAIALLRAILLLGVIAVAYAVLRTVLLLGVIAIPGAIPILRTILLLGVIAILRAIPILRTVLIRRQADDRYRAEQSGCYYGSNCFSQHGYLLHQNRRPGESLRLTQLTIALRARRIIDKSQSRMYARTRTRSCIEPACGISDATTIADLPKHCSPLRTNACTISPQQAAPRLRP
jgi:hypothetical protein